MEIPWYAKDISRELLQRMVNHAEGVSSSTPEPPLSSISTPASVLTSASVSTPSSVSTPATASTPAPLSKSAPVLTSQEHPQELQNRTLKEVGTIMCYVCDFDMCLPHMDSVDICKCSVGEDSLSSIASALSE